MPDTGYYLTNVQQNIMVAAAQAQAMKVAGRITYGQTRLTPITGITTGG